MKLTYRNVLCAALAALLLLPSGCAVVGVASKLLSNPSDPPIGELNSSEWQWVSENIADLAPQLGLQIPEGVDIPPLSQEESQAIVTFLDANNVNSVSDLNRLVQDAQNGDIVIPPELVELARAMGAQL